MHNLALATYEGPPRQFNHERSNIRRRGKLLHYLIVNDQYWQLCQPWSLAECHRLVYQANADRLIPGIIWTTTQWRHYLQRLSHRDCQPNDHSLEYGWQQVCIPTTLPWTEPTPLPIQVVDPPQGVDWKLVLQGRDLEFGWLSSQAYLRYRHPLGQALQLEGLPTQAELARLATELLEDRPDTSCLTLTFQLARRWNQSI